MDRRGRGAEQPREGRQPAIRGFVAGDDAAGQPSRIDDGEPWPVRADRRASGLEEGDVVRRIVGDENAASGELEERGDHRTEPRCAGDHAVGDAGEHGDERWDRGLGVDQRLELPEHVPPRAFTAPISVMRAVSGASPVVSRSTTTNVVSRSGVPSSSNVPWMPCPASWASPYPAAALMAGR